MPDEREGEELLTTTQVAELFAVDRHTVTRWIQLGQLPAFQTPGGRYRIRRADVEKLRGRLGGPP